MAGLPDLTIKVNVDTSNIKQFVRDTVVDYGRWLTRQNLLRSPTDSSDTRTHNELADDYFGSVRLT